MARNRHTSGTFPGALRRYRRLQGRRVSHPQRGWGTPSGPGPEGHGRKGRGTVSAALSRTADEWRRAAGEARAAWSLRATIVCALVLGAAVVPLLTGALGSIDTLANGLYLALAAVGLGFAVGIGGIPSLAQGAFVGVGAFVCM